jgi:hypothetical protein
MRSHSGGWMSRKDRACGLLDHSCIQKGRPQCSEGLQSAPCELCSCVQHIAPETSGEWSAYLLCIGTMTTGPQVMSRTQEVWGRLHLTQGIHIVLRCRDESPLLISFWVLPYCVNPKWSLPGRQRKASFRVRGASHFHYSSVSLDTGIFVANES